MLPLGDKHVVAGFSQRLSRAETVKTRAKARDYMLDCNNEPVLFEMSGLE